MPWGWPIKRFVFWHKVVWITVSVLSYIFELKMVGCNFYSKGSATPPVAATIFFGANDAALSGRTSERQHVPVDEYKENLRRMVHHLKV